jgi:hypothetical protein
MADGVLGIRGVIGIRRPSFVNPVAAGLSAAVQVAVGGVPVPQKQPFSKVIDQSS